MRVSSRFGLWAPLAALGVAAGAYGSALAHRLGFAPAEAASVAAVCMALFAASLGRRLQARDPADGPDRQAKAVVLVTTLVGAAAGWLQMAQLGQRRVVLGAAMGFAFGLVLLPMGASIVLPGWRALAARPRSIAARIGWAESWMTALTSAALLGLGAVLQWPALLGGGAPRASIDAVLLPAAAAAGSIAVLLGAAISMWRVRKACRGWTRMQVWEADPSAADAERIDLGIGDQIKGWIDRDSAYRDRGRPVWLVLGDPTATRAALRATLGRSLVSLSIALLVFCAHLACGMRLSEAFLVR